MTLEFCELYIMTRMREIPDPESKYRRISHSTAKP